MEPADTVLVLNFRKVPPALPAATQQPSRNCSRGSASSSLQCSVARPSSTGTLARAWTTWNSPDWSSTVQERRNDELTYCGVYEELMNDSWTLCFACCKLLDIVDCLEKEHHGNV